MILTFRNNSWVCDFKVAKNQKIIDVLTIINENSEYKMDIDSIEYLLSSRLNEKVNVLKTFKEANIYNGDSLEIGDK